MTYYLPNNTNTLPVLVATTLVTGIGLNAPATTSEPVIAKPSDPDICTAVAFETINPNVFE
jgi:hypothetical protein